MPENSEPSSQTSSEAGPVSGASTEKAKKQPLSREQKIDRWLDILSAIILSVVAIATAWNGYQAARWSSLAGMRYSQASARRVESTRSSTTAGQLVIIDATLFTNWINAYAVGDEPLLQFYQKRFRAEFVPAFDAWLATDPKNNPQAPPSPFAMPEYKLASSEEANQLEEEASNFFEEGKQAIAHSTDYVLNTVFLASVLFFIGISSRFKWIPLRATILILALAMLIYGMYNLATYPLY